MSSRQRAAPTRRSFMCWRLDSAARHVRARLLPRVSRISAASSQARSRASCARYGAAARPGHAAQRHCFICSRARNFFRQLRVKPALEPDRRPICPSSCGCWACRSASWLFCGCCTSSDISTKLHTGRRVPAVKRAFAVLDYSVTPSFCSDSRADRNSGLSSSAFLKSAMAPALSPVSRLAMPRLFQEMPSFGSNWIALL